MESVRRFFYNLMVDKDRRLWVFPIKFILWMLCLLYGLILWVRDVFYEIRILKPKVLSGAKIISVGNITLGGTGKTPTVIELATFLKQKGKRLAVLIRGYGQDEYEMLKKALKDIPIIKGKVRLKSGKEAIYNYGVDTLILDDGFQYRKLKKDFNIVLLDSRNPFGNYHILPRGILRERISNLKYTDVIILTKTEKDSENIKEKVKNIAPRAEIFFAYHKPLCLYDMSDDKEFSLDFLKNRKIAALSSIGDPGYFKVTLENLGAKIILEFSFLDHHNYKQKEIDKIISSCKECAIDTIITTEKDAAKLNRFSIDKNISLFFLKIKMTFRKDEDRFVDRLFGIYSR